MGWKNIKVRFEIKHIVQIRDNRICIGSGYIGEIISISFEGKLIKQYNNSRSNDDLIRYNAELIEAERRGELKELIDLPDTFENLKPIYTHEKGRVIKKFCEEYGYPNICTDGELIYQNTFFIKREDAVKDCRSDAGFALIDSARNFGEKVIQSTKQVSISTKRLFIALYRFIVSFFN